MKLFRKFFRLPAKDMFLFIEALLFLYVAKAMLLLLPFKFCLKTVNSLKLNGTADRDHLTRIKNSIRRANKMAFWKNVCLVQSIAGSWMLQRRGIKSTLFIGVKHDAGKKLVGHAWLNVVDFEIVPSGGDYIVLTQK